jgi:ADP-heptose:LPS heptosyltransferase
LSALFTNARVAPPASAVHVVHQYLALLAPLGVPCRTPEFRLGAWPAARARMDEFLFEGGVKPGDRLVALNPGAGLPDKRWPVGHFRALAERLAVEAQARSLILWGPEESSLAREIATSLAGRPLLAPPTDLHELAALLRRVSLMVAGDTGPLHLAAAVGAPTLGLFGPTRAARNGPYGARAASLQSATGRMDGLEPGVVFEAAQDLLDAA